MTNKQLYKRLTFIQNKFVDISNYSFYLAYHGIISKYFTVYIHCAPNHDIIYHNSISINHKDLHEKLQNLKNFVDELLNKE